MFDASDTVASFGERNFGHCFLGDPRRTRRLVRAADQILAHPDKALPHKFASPKDYRAVLRLVNHPAVTHAALLRVHAQRVLEQLRADGPAVVVLPEDTTELDFSGQNTLALGSIGNGGGQGFECHNTLAVDPHSRAIYGLVDQILHRRRKVPKGEGTDAKRRHPERESRLWVKAADNVGPAPEGQLWVHVCGRAADTFGGTSTSWFAAAACSFVFRSCQNRALEVEERTTAGHGCCTTGFGPGRRGCQATWAVEVSAQKAKNSQPAAVGARVATVRGGVGGADQGPARAQRRTRQGSQAWRWWAIRGLGAAAAGGARRRWSGCC